MGEKDLRIILSIIVSLIFLCILIYYLINLYKYFQLKEYFWLNLALDNKKFINYGFHRWVFISQDFILSPFSYYWKNEEKFQKERNTIILEHTPEKAELLMRTEKLLCILELFLLFLFAIIHISFSNI
jgi:hypothetical protein